MITAVSALLRLSCCINNNSTTRTTQQQGRCDDWLMLLQQYLSYRVSIPVYILLLFFLFAARYLFISNELHNNGEEGLIYSMVRSKRSTGSSNNNYNNVIYGHVHMAKTAGTSINGRLALQFERVCGHKGYSFKAYRSNNMTWDVTDQTQMIDWGFEDCDYISVETGGIGDMQGGWGTWDAFWKPLSTNMIHSFNVTLELHVPCRDPLEHLMSMCNMNGRHFNCYAKDLEQEFLLCANAEWQDRFSINMLNLTHTTVKCFNPIPTEPYIEYMSKLLQRRRFTHEYKIARMNRPRDRRTECVWNNKTDIRDKILNLMREKEYYKWCESCLGSENDLLYHGKG